MSPISSKLPSPRGFSPPRRAGSIRRTCSVDTLWPSGRAGHTLLQGIAQDIITPLHETKPSTLQQDTLFIEVDSEKHITAIKTTDQRSALEQLIGAHAIGELRSRMDGLLIADKAQGSPLYQLMTDITGCLIAADWAWASRKESSLPEARAKRQETLSQMEGVCIGFRPNSSALFTDGRYQASMAAIVPSMPHPQDPEGWHALPPTSNEVSFRRARRLDIWLDRDIIIESTFQDSATTEEGNRLAVHEYTVYATFDCNDLRLKSIDVTPHILPFAECPSAVDNIQQLVGINAKELRAEVSKRLRQAKGCTHLNDAVRALAEAPVLIKQLMAALNS